MSTDTTSESRLETVFLKQSVARRFGRRLATTADFSALSEEIWQELGVTVSSSTLKRLWGYVGLKVTPRADTLDVLSRYVGFRDYRAFAEDLRSRAFVSSGYFNSEHIDAASLQAGDTFTIGWRPDRVVTLTYLGANRFRVQEAANSLLREGDEFECSTILKGFPLHLSGIWRDGAWTDPYIAGRDGGIVFIK